MPQPMSPEESQELGRQYYKSKQYEKALETFSAAIEAAPSLSLYDHRAACYDRLKDFNAAIRDGRAMIKLDKQDVKGYLRTASILEKMDKLDTALGIYKYGIKNVPVSDKNFKLLQQLHDKITRRLSPAKAVDPLLALPVELAEMVLENLAFRNMVSCMRVSKGWRDYTSKLYRLWLHLDLSDAKRSVSRSFVDKAVRRSQYRLNRLTVHRFQHLDVVLNVAKACKGLSDIELLSLPHQASASLIELARLANNLKRYVLHPEISSDTVQQILRYRPTLEHAEFRSMNPIIHWTEPKEQARLANLHTLRLGGPAYQEIGVPSELLELTPALRTLISTDLGFGVRMSTLPLETLVLKRSSITTRLPPTLTHFTWTPSQSAISRASFARVLKSQLPSLIHLNLSDLHNMSAAWLSELLDRGLDDDVEGSQQYAPTKNGAPLEYISLKGALSPGTTSLFSKPSPTTNKTPGLFTGSPRILTHSLKHLAAPGLPCNDDEIEHLISHDLRLEYIDLSATNITGAAIKMLVDGMPTLKHIRADQASRINGRDAIEYAERKGVRVSCSMSEGKSGKKVRYV